jgi:hypothetical protein
MLNNKYTRGKTYHWLGLKDLNDARGLLFYSLETNQPLKTLRALNKIATLHARGEVYMPQKHNPIIELEMIALNAQLEPEGAPNLSLEDSSKPGPENPTSSGFFYEKYLKKTPPEN